jgi:DNA-directed RNA polymerase subunit F
MLPLIPKDEEEIRSILVSERARGMKDRVDSDSSDFLKLVKKNFPAVSPETLRKIQSDPTFLDDVIQKTLVDISGEISDVVRVVVDKAKEGNEKFIRLYFELMSRLKPQTKTSPTNAIQNNIYPLANTSTESLHEHITTMAKRLG